MAKIIRQLPNNPGAVIDICISEHKRELRLIALRLVPYTIDFVPDNKDLFVNLISSNYNLVDAIHCQELQSSIETG